MWLNPTVAQHKCGVACEGNAQQVNYLTDEAENLEKGADCTISLVHHYLEKYGCSEKDVQLQIMQINV